MTFTRLAAVALVFLGTTAAWSILGSSLLARTGQFDGRLVREVELLWGRAHTQVAPGAWVQRPGTETQTVEAKDAQGRPTQTRVTRPTVHSVPVAIDSTKAEVDLRLAHRRKGLLWYATYSVFFKATYTFHNPDAEARRIRLRLPLPAEQALYDDFVFRVDGRTVPLGADVSKDVGTTTEVAPGATVTLDVQYASRGLGQWAYAFAPSGTASVRDFELTMRTDFSDIDFPAGAMSPDTKTQTDTGWALAWRYRNLISGQHIGIELPNKLNPGPFAARVTFFAPVSLLFFLTVMVILGATDGPRLHPMHYWFIASAFFAFHLLLAYLVDHVSVHVAFAAAAFVSVGLVVSYLRAVTGMRHVVARAAMAQGTFLVLFSYAFFFEGVTGLAITIGAIVTLFVLMQMTARVSWDTVFGASGTRRGMTMEAGDARLE